jgi:hypothetical protein
VDRHSKAISGLAAVLLEERLELELELDSDLEDVEVVGIERNGKFSARIGIRTQE